MAGVLSCGIAVLDLVLYLDKLPKSASKFWTNEAAIVGGGCAASAAVAVARLGGESALVTRLGKDLIGDLIVVELSSENVDCSLVQRFDDIGSSFSSVIIDNSGERQIVNYKPAFPDSAHLLEFPSSDRYSVFLADNRWPPGAIATLSEAKARGIPGILDAEGPLYEGSEEAMEVASHVAFSSDGMKDLVGDGAREQQVRTVSERTGNWVCVTDGEKGVWWTENGGVRHMPAFKVDAVDTLGAGDAWHGAFALALAENKSEHEAVRFASAAAAIKCSRLGGRKGIPTRREVESFLNERSMQS